ncbi:MAG: hypothetical protein QM723_28320 [Myxococcaceae bacterium]
MNKTTRLLLGIGAVLLLVVVGAYAARTVLYPHELERNPPKLDGVKRAIMDEIHLEPNVTTDADLGSEDEARKVKVTFVFVPPGLDKNEAEKKVRDLVKAYLPKAHEVDVQFGDNLRTKAIDVEQRTAGPQGEGGGMRKMRPDR